MDYKWKDFRVILAARNRTTRNIMQKRWICNSNELRDNIAEMLEKVTATLKYRQLYNHYPVKKSKEISLAKLDLTLVPEDFALKNREHSSSLGYLIPTLNVTRAKKRKRYEINEQEQFSRILNIEQETFTPLVFSATRRMGR